MHFVTLVTLSRSDVARNMEEEPQCSCFTYWRNLSTGVSCRCLYTFGVGLGGGGGVYVYHLIISEWKGQADVLVKVGWVLHTFCLACCGLAGIFGLGEVMD